MPAIVKDFLSMTAVVGALSAFFVFATSRWVDGVEADVRQIKYEGAARQTKIVQLETLMGEVRDSLRRIEDKLDRAVKR